MANGNAGDTICSSGWFSGTPKVTQSWGDTSFEKPRHTGIDLGLSRGAPVTMGATVGQVVSVGNANDGYGNHVEVDIGNGQHVILGHFMDVAVKPGQTVNKGDVLGHVDSTGFSTGDHLHFEVRQSPFRYLSDIDPLSILCGSPAGTAGAAGAGATPTGGGLDNVAAAFSGINFVLQYLSDPANWWRIGITAAGVAAIMFGLGMYFKQDTQGITPLPIPI